MLGGTFTPIGVPAYAEHLGVPSCTPPQLLPIRRVDCSTAAGQAEAVALMRDALPAVLAHANLLPGWRAWNVDFLAQSLQVPT